jgi:ArsR family transcriptional regulator
MCQYILGEGKHDRFYKCNENTLCPYRVKSLKMLAPKALCVCEITAVLGLSQPTVSKHLKVLESAALVEFWKDGHCHWVNSRLAQKHESSYGTAMLENIAQWLSEERAIQKILAKVEKIDQEKIFTS